PGGSSRRHHQTLFPSQPAALLRHSLARGRNRPPDHPALTRSFHSRTHSRLPPSVAQASADRSQSTGSVADLQSRQRTTIPEVREKMNGPHLEVADIVRAQGEPFFSNNRSWIHWVHRKVLRAIA